LFVALFVLVCICAFQSDGFYRIEEDVRADYDTEENKDQL